MLYRAARLLLGVVFRVLWRPQVDGLEHVPADGPLLIASNHLSFIDSFVLPLAIPRRLTFLAKADYFDAGLLNAPRRVFFEHMGAVPIRRSEQREAQAALDSGLDVLQRGWAFGVYPEGTRSRDGRLYRGRTGVAWLALAAQAPVLPVGLAGTDRVQPVGARVPRVRPVRVSIGPAVQPGDYAGLGPAQARRRLTDEVMDRIAALSGQERAAGYNDPPP